MVDPVVLYVDDEPMSREVMEILITQLLGYEHLTLFEDSRDIMPRIEALEPRPTLIFLDIQMRPYSGFDVLRMLRDHPDFADVMVVAVTASVMSEEVLMLKSHSFDGCIGKPIDPRKFPIFMQRILAHETVWQVT